jgi:hypothetical protein
MPANPIADVAVTARGAERARRNQAFILAEKRVRMHQCGVLVLELAPTTPFGAYVVSTALDNEVDAVDGFGDDPVATCAALVAVGVFNGITVTARGGILSRLSEPHAGLRRRVHKDSA